MTYLLRRTGLIALGISSILLPSIALAQAPEGLQIKPAIVEDNVNLGEFTEYSVTVRNLSGGERTFFLSTQDIKGLDDQGSPVFAEEGEQTGYELASWVSLPSSAVVLGPGETKTIPFSVHVPNTSSPGAHFGAIFLTTRPPAPGETGSAVGFSVGTIVSLKIAGDTHEIAQLREFSTGKIVYGSGVVDFATRIENSGNVLVRPHGSINITDMFGRNVGSVEVNPNGAPVFPGSSRKYASKWEHEGFLFGRYEAIAAYSYGETESKTITATASFWILPLKPLAIALGALLAIIVGMYALIRVYIRRKLRDMGISPDSRDANYYARKYQRSGSRMMMVTLIVFIVCIFFLAVLFLAFA
jgi:hypothetical protein